MALQFNEAHLAQAAICIPAFWSSPKVLRCVSVHSSRSSSAYGHLPPWTLPLHARRD